jgi:hypothetical protein
MCVKNIIASVELWVDGDFKRITVEVKGIDPKYMWEIMVFTELQMRICWRLKD